MADFATTHLAGADALQFRLGGWEYTHYGSLQRTDYDNVELTVVPEPASLALLGLGGLTFLRRRRRR